jgi:hypothetical protein
LAKIDHESCADAFAALRTGMADATDEDDPFTALFALWAARRMRLADVFVANDETTYAKVRKDSDAERGRRMCIGGTVIEITVDKVTTGGHLSHGLLLSYGQNLYHFLAAASTGDLVQTSDARFCGIATGRYDYANSGGGTGHAVTLVGMFDLPQNRPPKPVTAAAPLPGAAVAPPLAPRMRACCAALHTKANQSGESLDGVQLTTIASQCDSLAAVGTPDSMGALRASLADVSPPLPKECLIAVQ